MPGAAAKLPIMIDSASSRVREWVGLFLAPLTFLAHLEANYLLVPWSCATDRATAVHAAGIASVIVGALGTAIAWRIWRGATRVRSDAADAHARPRFMGVVGTGVGAVCTLILVAQTIATFIIPVCQR